MSIIGIQNATIASSTRNEVRDRKTFPPHWTATATFRTRSAVGAPGGGGGLGPAVNHPAEFDTADLPASLDMNPAKRTI